MSADPPRPADAPAVAPAVAPAEAAAPPTASYSLSRVLGGPRGVLESVLPYTIFSLVYGVQRELRAAIVAALVPVVVLAVWRIIRRESLSQAVSGVIGVAIGAYAATKTGNAANFFLPNIIKNAGFAIAYAVSIPLRWPLLGLVLGPLLAVGRQREQAAGREPSGRQMLTELVAWRHDPPTLAAYGRATWLWVGLFVVRLAVQVPLYLAGAVTLLGLLNALVLGVPLFAVVVFLSWLMLRDVLRGSPTG